MKKIRLTLVILFFTSAYIAIAATDISTLTNANVVDDERTSGFNTYPTNPNAIKPQRFIYEVKPGESINDSITVENYEEKNGKFEVYGVDSFINEKNNRSAKQRTDEQTEVGLWISVTDPMTEVLAKEIKEKPFTINVPADTENGLYFGHLGADKFTDQMSGPYLVRYRKMLTVEITVTDNPQPVPSYKEEWNKAYANALKQKATSYVTGAIFIACFGYIAYDFIKRRKKVATSKAPTKK